MCVSGRCAAVYRIAVCSSCRSLDPARARLSTRRATDTCVRFVELVFEYALLVESVNRVEEKREDLRAIPRMLEDEENAVHLTSRRIPTSPQPLWLNVRQ